jgi:Domain of unknown function (DUF4258)
MSTRAEDLRPSKHARRRMRLYNVSLSDLARLLENIEAETPSPEPGRMVIGGTTPDGRRLRLIVPSETREVIVTLYPLSPPPRR